MPPANGIPEGFHSVAPSLTVNDGKAALAFYEKALGAKIIAQDYMPNGKLIHGDIIVGNSHILLNDAAPEFGAKSPSDLGGTPVQLWLYCEDTDATFQRAISAGATSLMEPQDMFWGDRYAMIEDPFGHKWGIATRVEDLSQEELDRRAKEFFAQPAGNPA